MTLSCSQQTISIITRNNCYNKVIFIVLITFILLRQKKVFGIKKHVKIKDFCYVNMLSDDTKLELNQYQKSDKAPFIVFADLECMIKKIDRCKNNPENSSTTKASEHISSGFSMSAVSSYINIEDKHDVYINAKIT